MKGAVLIAALSGRALAQHARASGYEPLVADLYCDRDTQRLARAASRVAPRGQGFDQQSLIDALRGLARDSAPIGLVYGAGFEHCPDLLDELAVEWRVLGCGRAAVARVKDPFWLAQFCAQVGMPHPAVAQAPLRSDWLVKRRGASGGAHIRLASAAPVTHGDDEYAQARAPGEAASLLALCDGQSAHVVGFTSQWAAPAPGAPLRYGGALRPYAPQQSFADAARAFAHAATRACDLRGLVSFDYRVTETSFHLIEINPRPGASLDVFTQTDGALFAAHVAACAGRAPPNPLSFCGAEAAAVYYAPCATAAPDLSEKDGFSDVPQAGVIGAGQPVCTVRADAASADAAILVLQERLRALDEALMKGEAVAL
ncbi:MAG: ATP-grasp domain-containing protein [Hyphomicrobiales bacterium]|nr:ATP-grasp domain-containing protein [Hyphomicrobiales bacterium]